MVLVLALASGCTSTHLVNTWRDPSFAGPIEFKKVLAVAVRPDDTTRRTAEDAMVRQIGPGRCVAGYQVVNEAARVDASDPAARPAPIETSLQLGYVWKAALIADLARGGGGGRTRSE